MCQNHVGDSGCHGEPEHASCVLGDLFASHVTACRATERQHIRTVYWAALGGVQARGLRRLLTAEGDLQWA